MNDAAVACALWFLAAIRIPTIREGWAKHALYGSAFAAMGFTLYIPDVYVFIDGLLGGDNAVGLVLSEFVIASLWQIYTSLALATADRLTEVPDSTRRSLSMSRRWWFTCGGAMLLTFFFWDTPESTRWLISVYGAQGPLLVFQIVGVCFIAGVSLRAVAICWPRRHEFGGLFRMGFAAVVIGFAGAAALVGFRVLGSFLPAGSSLKYQVETFYEIGQQIVVLLVAVGLSLPRLTVVAMSITASVRSLVILRKLFPAWSRVVRQDVLGKAGMQRNPLVSNYRWNMLARLQRRVTEIRDAQAVSGTLAGSLSFSEHRLLEQAETLLYGTQTKTEITE